MSLIRIIPRLDIKGPNVVKGLCFDGYRVLGHPETFAEKYYKEGADELFFQDTVASLYKRSNLLEIVRRTAEKVMLPITVCGGIRSINDIKAVLRSGADKVAINTAAILNPEILKDSSKIFGSQCIVSSIEAKKKQNGKYEAWVDYGRQPTGVDVLEWSEKVIELGVGEIYLSTVDRDGTGLGFDVELVEKVSSISSVPVIASSGAGQPEHFEEVIKKGCADAVSSASIFHYHYEQTVEEEFMSYNEQKLRMGEQIDSGNIEFLKSGYGGLSDLQVNPCSINKIKNFLKKHEISVR